METINLIEVKPKIILANDELQKYRLNICNFCEFYSVNKDVEIGKEYCSACDCILLNKVANEESECPKGKW